MKVGILARKDALARGASQYFTGKPCKRGHLATRRVLDRTCTACSREYPRDKERDSARQKKKYKINREHMAARNRKWNKENQEKIREIAREWKKNNRERHLQNGREWRRQNKERVSVYNSRRRSRYNGHTSDDVADILRMQRGRCACCKVKTGEKYHVDHIIALKNGGSNLRSNLQILCAGCNLSKAARDPVDFMRSRGRLL
jgi:5-methylcytosine-specific restriction endonuclease McrA